MQFPPKYYSSKCHCYKCYLGSTAGNCLLLLGSLLSGTSSGWGKPDSSSQGFEILMASRQQMWFCSEAQPPKSESSYTEKMNVVSKLILWNVVTLFTSSFLMSLESPTPVIPLHSLDPLRWFKSFTWQKMNCRGINPPTSFLLLLFLIISSTYYKKDKG